MSPDSLVLGTVTECNGDRLIFDPNWQASNKQTISFIIKIIAVLVLIIWLVGSYFHKLIGIETLHALHIIFITQAMAPRYKPAVIYFNNLNNSMNLFQNFIITPETFSSSKY